MWIRTIKRIQSFFKIHQESSLQVCVVSALAPRQKGSAATVERRPPPARRRMLQRANFFLFLLVFRFLPKTIRSSFLLPFCIASTNRWHIQIEMFSLPVGDSQLWLWLSWPWQQQTAKLFPTGRDETPKTKAKAHFIHGWKRWHATMKNRTHVNTFKQEIPNVITGQYSQMVSINLT